MPGTGAGQSVSQPRSVPQSVPEPVSQEVLLARAYLSRVAEPGNIPMWNVVRTHGPVEAARLIRDSEAGEAIGQVTEARKADADPEADLAAAERHGIRLVVPESPDWPHFAFAALDAAARARFTAYSQGRSRHAEHGEPMTPLALWVSGPGDLRTLAMRSLGVVGARAATPYGETVARRLAREAASAGFTIVSGGAVGIDAAAHRGALDARGETVIVTAGGAERAYPSCNAALFDAVRAQGLIISESPPGSAPQRRRFLTRNRLVAALSTGTLVVEASMQSGALNTVGHCHRLGRPIMAVPGPITSAVSTGSNHVLAHPRWGATLVASFADVLGCVGGAGDVPETVPVAPDQRSDTRRKVLDGLDELSRHVFDGLPAGRAVQTDEIVLASGRPVGDVLRALPVLELAGLVERSGAGFRVAS